jgi:glucose-1-phosphate cytidylyltransferase
MKVVILAGGRGTRISEETERIPKPMVEIGGKPILWHIMKTYSHFGYNDFIICLGYKGYIIKEYFSHYFLHMSDVTIDLANNSTTIHNTSSEPWKITLVDTGIESMTGSRLKKAAKYLNNEPFMMTYGDGVADVDVNKVVSQHKKSGKLATMSTVQDAGRFGVIEITQDNSVKSFLEKPKGETSWINIGYFVLEPKALEYIAEGSDSIWERKPLETLAKDDQLNAYKHTGFWKPMDTLRDKFELEKLWQENRAPWKVWK